MVKVKVQVPNARLDTMKLDRYMRIVHQHLRYAGVVSISEFPPDEDKPIEFSIEVDAGWAEETVKRIKSFGDYAEIMGE